jgi:hypothetical protein
MLRAVRRAYVSPADALWSKSLSDFAENGFARCKGDSHGNSCSAKKKASSDAGAEVLLEISGYWSHAARRCARGPSPRRQMRKRRARDPGRREAIVTEPDRDGITARLWKLPGQLLLALINATAILVIVAAILALVAIARIDHFAENVVATMTEAVLSKVDLPAKDVLANLQKLTAEVRALRDAVGGFKTGENPTLQIEIAQLKEKLTVLNISVERLRSTRSILTDEAIAQLGRTVTDALMKLRDCSSSVGQLEPHRTPRK